MSYIVSPHPHLLLIPVTVFIPSFTRKSIGHHCYSSDGADLQDLSPDPALPDNADDHDCPDRELPGAGPPAPPPPLRFSLLC